MSTWPIFENSCYFHTYPLNIYKLYIHSGKLSNQFKAQRLKKVLKKLFNAHKELAQLGTKQLQALQKALQEDPVDYADKYQLIGMVVSELHSLQKKHEAGISQSAQSLIDRTPSSSPGFSSGSAETKASITTSTIDSNAKLSDIVYQLIAAALSTEAEPSSRVHNYFKKTFTFKEEKETYTFNFLYSWTHFSTFPPSLFVRLRERIREDMRQSQKPAGIKFQISLLAYDLTPNYCGNQSMWLVTASGPEGLLQFFERFFGEIRKELPQVEALIQLLQKKLNLAQVEKTESASVTAEPMEDIVVSPPVPSPVCQV